MWENRCYSNGIPDQVDRKLMLSGRAPSWKAVALAILKNDHKLQSLGFSCNRSDYAESLYRNSKIAESRQLELFGTGHKQRP